MHTNGIFQICMGSRHHEPTEHNVDAIMAMRDAEKTFEFLMAHISRTKFKDDLHVRLAMSALIGAWSCVTRTRSAAGIEMADVDSHIQKISCLSG